MSTLQKTNHLPTIFQPSILWVPTGEDIWVFAGQLPARPCQSALWSWVVPPSSLSTLHMYIQLGQQKKKNYNRTRHVFTTCMFIDPSYTFSTRICFLTNAVLLQPKLKGPFTCVLFVLHWNLNLPWDITITHHHHPSPAPSPLPAPPPSTTLHQSFMIHLDQ